MSDITERIAELKKARNAVILAHNYCLPEVQDIADMVGDSLGLSVKAAETDANVIVFCGVTFMGETAKILSPGKRVLLPDPDAICDMAAMCSPEALEKARMDDPGRTVVGYVNTTGPTKCQMDVCCTSGNALKVVGNLDSDRILFVPDRNLGDYVSRNHPGKDIRLWNGCCPIHDGLTASDLDELISANPGAYVMAHPECRAEILERCDFIGSTEAMLKQIPEVENDAIIVMTEVGMLHRMELAFPEKRFSFPGKAVCGSMKLTTLEKIADCLENMTGEVILDERIIREAYAPVKKMTEIL